MYRITIALFLLLVAFAAVAQTAPAGQQATSTATTSAMPSAPAQAAPAAPAPTPVAPAVPSTELSVTGGTLYGTLLQPDAKIAKGKVPVVLLIAGSGPTDRNGNTRGLPGANNALKMLAEGLATNGIATLRFDKRGIAESAKAGPTEADLRFDTYVDDAAAWCNHLREDKRFSSVIVAGHSEGSLIGMLAAKKCNAAGFISLEGAGRPAAALIRTQLAGKLPPDMALESEAVLKELEAGRTTEKYPQQLAMLYRPSVQPYLISWFKYDPARAIAELKMPVLIVQGSTDVQVTVDESKTLAMAKPDAKVAMIKGMNHVLKVAPAEQANQMAAYTDPTVQLAEGLVPAVVSFVRSTAK